MKRKSNKIFVFLIFLIVVILIAGGVLAYLFLKTDMFTDKKALMFKTLSNQNISKMLDTSKYYAYADKSIKNSNQATTDVTLKLTGNNTESINSLLGLDISNITVRNIKKNDVNLNAISNDMDIQYMGNDLFAFSVVKYGENYGIKSDEIVNRYVACNAENIENICSKYEQVVEAQIDSQIEQTPEQIGQSQEEMQESQIQENQAQENQAQIHESGVQENQAQIQESATQENQTQENGIQEVQAQESQAQTATIQEEPGIVNIQRQTRNSELTETQTNEVNETNIQTIEEINRNEEDISLTSQIQEQELNPSIDQLNLKNNFMPNIEKQAIENVYLKYAQVFYDNVTDEDIQIQKNVDFKANGETIKVDEYTLSLTESKFKKIKLELLNTLVKDENIRNGFINFAKSIGGNFTNEQYENEIQEAITKINAEPESENLAFKLSVYGNNKKTVKILIEFIKTKETVDLEFTDGETNKMKITYLKNNEDLGVANVITQEEEVSKINSKDGISVEISRKDTDSASVLNISINQIEAEQVKGKIDINYEISGALSASLINDNLIIDYSINDVVINTTFKRQCVYNTQVGITELNNETALFVDRLNDAEFNEVAKAINEKIELVMKEKEQKISLISNNIKDTLVEQPNQIITGEMADSTIE